MVVPPDQHGDQRVVMSHVALSPQGGRISRRRDRFANHILNAHFSRIGSTVEFDVRIVVERTIDSGGEAEPAPVATRWLTDPGLLTADRLTLPGRRLRRAAERLAAKHLSGIELAAGVNEWVRNSLDYRYGVTGIHTSAEEALGHGAGVCQDYAHVMIALCRLLGQPARYVSGHLLGEGGTHAWVEVLLPHRGGVAAHGFDPTNGCPVGIRYVTVAVGRDYEDVAPTSGRYVGGPGSLTSTKRVDVVGFEYG